MFAEVHLGSCLEGEKFPKVWHKPQALGTFAYLGNSVKGKESKPPLGSSIAPTEGVSP
jgi:hypothetical protein